MLLKAFENPDPVHKEAKKITREYLCDTQSDLNIDLWHDEHQPYPDFFKHMGKPSISAEYGPKGKQKSSK